jgi:hypothetical protein
VVKWDNAYLHADAICFKFDNLGKASSLKWNISDLTDFSYDFQDLDFIKIATNLK